MEEMNLRHYAYLGDAVLELFVREHTILKAPNAKELHKITTEKVKASYQADLLNLIEAQLNEEEHELARRGRNLQIPIARRSNQAEYRQATAFETLVGWWYLNDKSRLEKIFSEIEKNL